jgi:heme/copper-type cytochrome/quinol oxidase subunit 2
MALILLLLLVIVLWAAVEISQSYAAAQQAKAAVEAAQAAQIASTVNLALIALIALLLLAVIVLAWLLIQARRAPAASSRHTERAVSTYAPRAALPPADPTAQLTQLVALKMLEEMLAAKRLSGRAGVYHEEEQ